MVPDHSFANWALSIAYADLEDYEKAMTCVNIAFKNEDNLYKKGRGTSERDLWTTRGFLYHKLGQTDKGIADLEEALNIDTDNSFAHRNLGIVYYESGNYDLACQYLQIADELGYKKNYDRYDLEDYLIDACKKADDLKDEILAKSEPIKTPSIVNNPYVYPNPVKDIVRIKNLSFENFEYEIYDYSSKLVSKNNTTNGSVILSDLPEGVYVLKVIGDEGFTESIRFIKD